MKTFSEFLEEALISSLIKAAARQFVKSKVLQKAIPKVKTIPMRNHWTNKAIPSLPVPSNAPEKLDYQKLYHGTTKPASQAISKDGWKTDVNVSQQKRGAGVYVTPDKNTAIGYAADKVRQTGETPDWNNISIRRFNMPKNVYDDAMKRQVQNPDDWANISQVKQVTMKPSYANKIDITDKPNSAIDFTNSQRDEIKRRVAAGLKNKANQDQINRELGINPIKEQKTFSQFLEEATKIISLKTFHHGSDEESVKSIKRKGPKPSPQGSEGPGHYVTPDREKAEKYAEFTSKQRNKKPAVVSYSVSTQSIQKTSDIPKGLTSKPKTSAEKPVVQNTRTGHVAMDADYANKRMIRNPQPIMRTSDKPKRTKTQPKRK